MISINTVILDRFAHDVDRAYSLMLEELAKLLRNMDLTAELRLGTAASVRLTIVEELDLATHDDRYKRALKIIGRCGGRVGAATRRARTAIALEHLDRLAASGHALTATTANNITKQAGGTGLGRLARAKYGNPGIAGNRGDHQRDQGGPGSLQGDIIANTVGFGCAMVESMVRPGRGRITVFDRLTEYK